MRKLVLVGGGHSHLFVLDAFARRREPDVQMTLVAPSPLSTYSGMVPGVIAGRYALRQAQIDVQRLAERAGAAFTCAAVTSIDAAARRLHLSDAPACDYDLVSFNIGAEPQTLPRVAADAPLLQVKPFAAAADRFATALAAPRTSRIVILGGGAAGLELAWAFAARVRQRAGAAVTVCDRGTLPLRERAGATQQLVLRELARANIRWRGGAVPTAIESAAVVFADGETLPADLVVNATGAAGLSLFAAAGLPTDARGFLRVADDLRCLARPEIFASGDCASLASFPRLPRAGVYAVRQGPVLAHNLRAALRQSPLQPYRAQPRTLALLNTADGQAIFSYGRFAWHGRTAWWLKDAIDRRFVARFA